MDAVAAPAAEAAVPEAPPSETEVDIRFVIVPEGFSHTRRFALTTTVAEVKAFCEGDLRIPVSNMKLVYAGAPLGDEGTLQSYDFKAGTTHQVELQIVYLEEHTTPSSYVMPDVVSVEVQFGADIPPKLIQVPIVRAMPEKKPFLGGFRSRKTALEYHHASSQTDPPPRPADAPLPPQKFERETQTAVQQTRSQITVREAGTQMTRGYASAEEGDVLLAPLPYFDSEQLASLRLAKAIDVQRYTRGWFARCAAAALRRKQAEEEAALQAAEEAQRQEVQARHAREIQRRMHPQTYGDFEVLYNELEAWRLQETKRINELGVPEEERLALLAQLLQKEQKLLQTIDRLRLQAADENREKQIRWMLQLMSSPKRWQMSDGEVAQVHTPFTTRAKELMELYNGLMLPLLTVDERLDVLLHLSLIHI